MKLTMALSLALVAQNSHAISPPSHDVSTGAGETHQLDAVLVTGTRPGPGLWRVSNGTRKLWLLATVSPLPAHLDWRSTDVIEVLDRADAVLSPPRANADISAGDIFKMARLARSANAATKLPNRQTLRDVLPADLYAKWLLLKGKYLPGITKTDRLRPMFASQDLYYESISRAGFTRNDTVWGVLKELSEERGVPIVRTDLAFPLNLDFSKYKTGIRALSTSELDDVTCFKSTVDGIEGDLMAFAKISNAWAIGDIEELKHLRFADIQPPCKSVYDSAMSFQSRDAVNSQLAAAWLASVENALATNVETLAVVPLHDLLKAGGYLDALRSRGYSVLSPDEVYGAGVDES